MAEAPLAELALPGATFAVKVKPGARRNLLTQTEAGLKVEVTAAPEDGRANQAVRKLLAKALGVAPSAADAAARRHLARKAVPSGLRRAPATAATAGPPAASGAKTWRMRAGNARDKRRRNRPASTPWLGASGRSPPAKFRCRARSRHGSEPAAMGGNPQGPAAIRAEISLNCGGTLVAAGNSSGVLAVFGDQPWRNGAEI